MFFVSIVFLLYFSQKYLLYFQYIIICLVIMYLQFFLTPTTFKLLDLSENLLDIFTILFLYLTTRVIY
ncbi:hypothetical protein CLOM621_08808 [Clostridium sp. M62/1]|nr:hypothetical protein CLOM621_08808 [Clostridium sp. M62/1]